MLPLVLLQACGTSARCWLEAVWALGQRRVDFWAPGLPEEEVAGEMEREEAAESRGDHCLHSTLQVRLEAPGPPSHWPFGVAPPRQQSEAFGRTRLQLAETPELPVAPARP